MSTTPDLRCLGAWELFSLGQERERDPPLATGASLEEELQTSIRASADPRQTRSTERLTSPRTSPRTSRTGDVLSTYTGFWVLGSSDREDRRRGVASPSLASGVGIEVRQDAQRCFCPPNGNGSGGRRRRDRVWSAGRGAGEGAYGGCLSRTLRCGARCAVRCRPPSSPSSDLILTVLSPLQY